MISEPYDSLNLAIVPERKAGRNLMGVFEFAVFGGSKIVGGYPVLDGFGIVVQGRDLYRLSGAPWERGDLMPDYRRCRVLIQPLHLGVTPDMVILGLMPTSHLAVKAYKHDMEDK